MTKRTSRTATTRAAEAMTLAALWELEFQMRRLESVPGDGPLDERQQRQHAKIAVALGAALDAVASDGPSEGTAIGLEHVALLVKLLSDELGAPHDFQARNVVH